MKITWRQFVPSKIAIISVVVCLASALSGHVMRLEYVPYLTNKFTLAYMTFIIVGFFIITFVSIHLLLTLNVPLRLNKIPWIRTKLPKLHVPTTKPIDIDSLVADVDKRFISSWYSYIGNDNTFTNETRLLLRGVITKLLHDLNKFNSKRFIHGVLLVYLRHVREYRKAMERIRCKEAHSLEEAYRHGHWTSKAVAASSVQWHLLQVAANVLHKYFDPEVWNSLPCHTTISIFARKAMMYSLTSTAAPGYLNALILKKCSSRKDDFAYVSLSDDRHGGEVPTFPAPPPPDTTDNKEDKDTAPNVGKEDVVDSSFKDVRDKSVQLRVVYNVIFLGAR